MADTDESLLLSFAIDRDEDAFRALSERYLGLIFHTALRRTCNRQLAEEVSQNILCALAQKASSLAKNPDRLPAWLHRATLFESSKAMRKESIHQRRKQLLPSGESAESPSPWRDAIPHLDLALDKLPESDRRVLLLHFFENRPFPEIAQALGKNPDAVQKQSRRALEKLARILRSRGVTLSATAITAGLSSELAKAAPAAFLQSATTAVLAGTASYSTTGLTLMTAAKSNAFVPLVVLLCITPLAVQQVAISEASSRNDAFRSRLAVADNSGTAVRDRPGPVSNSNKFSTSIDILVLVDEQTDARRSGGLKQIAFAEKIAGLSEDTLVRLIQEGAVIRVPREKKTGLLEVLIRTMAEKDARLAVTTAVAAFPASPELESLISQTQVTSHFSTWADSDPISALAWYQEQGNSGKFRPGTRSGDSGPIREFKAPMIRALAGTNDPEAVVILESATGYERDSLLRDVLRRLNPTSDPSSSSIAIRLMPVIREVFTGESSGEALGIVGTSLADVFGDGRLPDATEFLDQAELEPAERLVIIRSVAEGTLGTQRMPFDPKRDAKIDAELFTWLKSTAPRDADQIMEDARARKAATETYQAEQAIGRIRGIKDPTDQQLVSELTNGNLKSHLQEALALAQRIKDPEKRANTVEFLNKL